MKSGLFRVFFHCLEIRINFNFLKNGEVTPSGAKFFTVDIFRMNTSKYAKLMVQSYICDILNQIYRLFSLLTKKILNSLI